MVAPRTPTVGIKADLGLPHSTSVRADGPRQGHKAYFEKQDVGLQAQIDELRAEVADLRAEVSGDGGAAEEVVPLLTFKGGCDAA